MIVNLPHNFEARPYQYPILDAFFKKGYKRFISVWHRRAGKDRTWFNIIIAAAMQRPGLYIYSFPTLTQARKALWEGRGKDGTRYLDQIPREILAREPNNSEMKIELVNGSIIRMGGTDSYDAWVGTNPLGIIFSEYALQNPLAWDLLRPIMAENEGWAAFIYTPRGHNHGYDLYYNNAKNPRWFVSMLTVDDTKDESGKPIVSRDIIEEERIAGMSDDMIEQEFYCSFEASLRGAIFELQLKRAREEERIIELPVDQTSPVYTFWDLGRNDSTTIWFIQKKKGGEYWQAIYYYENLRQHINHYIGVLEEVKKRFNIFYAKHFLPHDATQMHIESEYSVLGYFNKAGLSAQVVPRTETKQSAIEKGRVALDRCYFHTINCAQGIECLRSYRKEYNEKLKVYKEDPIHDWASHGADSFLQFGQALNGNLISMSDDYNHIRYNVVNSRRI